MPEPLLPAVELNPENPAADAAPASVIWLHGLGASGHDFPPVVPHLGLPPDHNIRFIFPHAPQIPVTLNMGMVMPAWYDIREMDLKREHDLDGVKRSQTQLEAWIDHEVARGSATDRIILAGFSQGGAIALYSGLRTERPLAGILALSTYLPNTPDLDTEATPTGRALPILMCHGTHDPMVTLDRGEDSRNRITTLGAPITWQTWPMQHEVCLEEIQTIGTWLQQRLP